MCAALVCACLGVRVAVDLAGCSGGCEIVCGVVGKIGNVVHNPPDTTQVKEDVALNRAAAMPDMPAGLGPRSDEEDAGFDEVRNQIPVCNHAHSPIPPPNKLQPESVMFTITPYCMRCRFVALATRIISSNCRPARCNQAGHRLTLSSFSPRSPRPAPVLL